MNKKSKNGAIGFIIFLLILGYVFYSTDDKQQSKPADTNTTASVKQEATQVKNTDQAKDNSPKISPEDARKQADTTLKEVYKSLNEEYDGLNHEYQKQKGQFNEPYWHNYVNATKDKLNKDSSEIDSLEIMKGTGANKDDIKWVSGANKSKDIIGGLIVLCGMYNDDLTGHELDSKGISETNMEIQTKLQELSKDFK